MDKKPKNTYLAFVAAFAIEMHGIPFSMWVISWIVGKELPEGVFGGHTLVSWIGLNGMYLNIACAIIAFILILSSWRQIHKNYWSKDTGEGKLVKEGFYHYIRHPQYTGLLLLSFGMIAEWATIPLLIMYPVMVLMYFRLAKQEEMDILSTFGEEYKTYMKDTKMLIPFIVNLKEIRSY